MSGVAVRYQQTLIRILSAIGDKSGAVEDANKVTLIVVSKTRPVEQIEALYHLGHRDFGENYVQELVAKAEELRRHDCTGIRWHFIGHLQTNKVKALIQHVYAVHTLDSEKLASDLSKRWRGSGREGMLPVFIEVNVDREKSKSGVLPESVVDFAKSVGQLSELSLQGLMCIPNSENDMVGLQSAFRDLRELELRCRPWTQGKLSMGMSADFELAIQEGATHIRVGSAILPRSSAVLG